MLFSGARGFGLVLARGRVIGVLLAAAAFAALSAGSAESAVTGTPYHWHAATVTVDPNSAQYMNAWTGPGGYFPSGSGLLINGGDGVATATSTSGSPCYAVPLSLGGQVDQSICIPLGTKPAAGPHGHLSIYDPIHKRVTDFWQAIYNAKTRRITSASSGDSFSPSAVQEHPAPPGGNGGACGDAACIPLRAGLLEPSNFTNPAGITHALVFSTPGVGCNATSANCSGAGNDDYRYPADHNSQTCGSSCAYHMVDGTWLRMNPGVNCAAYGLTSWQQKICVALQKYGMFLRDDGVQVGIYADTRQNQGGAANWTRVGVPAGSPSLGQSFPWNRMQVLDPP